MSITIAESKTVGDLMEEIIVRGVDFVVGQGALLAI